VGHGSRRPWGTCIPGWGPRVGVISSHHALLSPCGSRLEPLAQLRPAAPPTPGIQQIALQHGLVLGHDRDHDGSLQPTNHNKIVSKKQFEEIKRILGVECLLIVIDEKKHDCDPTTCMRHWFYIRSDGFMPQHLHGISHVLMDGSDEIAQTGWAAPPPCTLQIAQRINTFC
jgi:hypothetical protein